MRDTVVLPTFRSPELRDLVREAIQHGAEVRLSGGGHAIVSNPATGDRVSLSTTARASRMGHTLGNSRRSLERAGLLAPRRPRQEVRPMAMASTTTEEPKGLHAPRPGGQRAGGKYARVGEVEVLTVKGRRVRVWERADGQWVAETPWPGATKGVRAWAATDREAVLDRLRANIDSPPKARGTRKAEAPATPATDDGAALDHVEREPTPTTAGWGVRTDGTGMYLPPTDPEVAAEEAQRFDTVRDALDRREAAMRGEAAPEVSPMTATVLARLDDPEEFPLVRNLAALDATLAPALAALEAAGKVDAADLIRGELIRSPLEEEALALYRRLMSRD